jgi:hypothetical protein
LPARFFNKPRDTICDNAEYPKRRAVLYVPDIEKIYWYRDAGPISARYRSPRRSTTICHPAFRGSRPVRWVPGISASWPVIAGAQYAELRNLKRSWRFIAVRRYVLK